VEELAVFLAGGADEPCQSGHHLERRHHRLGRSLRQLVVGGISRRLRKIGSRPGLLQLSLASAERLAPMREHQADRYAHL